MRDKQRVTHIKGRKKPYVRIITGFSLFSKFSFCPFCVIGIGSELGTSGGNPNTLEKISFEL